MRTIGRTGLRAVTLLAAFCAVLLRVCQGGARRAVNLVPRRFRRIAEKIESMPGRSAGHHAAIAFVGCFVLYGLVIGGHLQRFAESMLVGIGLEVGQIAISGQEETSEHAILEELRIGVGQSLLTYNVHKARDRVGDLPWVARATVRKLYPANLEVIIEEKLPIALWQNNNEISIIDGGGKIIAAYEDPRFVGLPLIVGNGANIAAAAFLAELDVQSSLLAKTKASVFVAERRWNLVLKNGIVVKLPESGLDGALDQLALLDSVDELLSRDIIVVDLRLPNRITVQLPDDTAESLRTKSAAEIERHRKSGART